MNEIVESYKTTFLNWKDFQGRASRKEFWTFFGVYFGEIIIASAIDGALFHSDNVGLFTGLVGLANLVPLLAVAFRRLHDSGKSGSYLALLLIPAVITSVPFVGGTGFFKVIASLVGLVVGVYQIYLLAQASSDDNQYGPKQ